MPAFSPRVVIRAVACFAVLTALLGRGVIALAQQPAGSPAAADSPFRLHIKAPSLTGGYGWINTAGPLDVKDLKGKIVILDFWTYCCINCMHILPELKKLERAYPNELVVIGVHSAKFLTEKDNQNITDAVMRYEIEHPVVNDADLAIWTKYSVGSWPSIRIIDPEGYVIEENSGETTFDLLDKFMKAAIPYYKKRGTLDSTPLHFSLAAESAAQTPLRYPGKVLADEAGQRLFIADSNHNRIVIAGFDGELKATIGSGAIGQTGGSYAKSTFNKPQGMALRGNVLYVADTENHLLRKIDLNKQTVTTIAGTGEQSRAPWPGMSLVRGAEQPKRFVGPPKTTGINSPWDLWIHGKDLYIAMAGPHQIWKMTLDEKEIGPYAGNGQEDIVDGPLLPPKMYEPGFASFAQPSGLASDGEWLFVADSEGSSIRAVPLATTNAGVRTVIGTAKLPQGRLFTFGDVDGEPGKALLQHCLGVLYHDKQLYVADTYNNKIKVVDPQSGIVKTLAGDGKQGKQDSPAQFDEPAGLTVAAGTLYVADTNNHLVRTIDLKANRVGTFEVKGLRPPSTPAEKPAVAGGVTGGKRVTAPSTTIKPQDDALRLGMKLQLPAGHKLNLLAPMTYRIEAADKNGPVDRGAIAKTVRVEKPATDLEVLLPLKSKTGGETLKVALTYYYCQEGAEGLCKVGTVIWTVAVKLNAEAKEDAVALAYQVE